MFSPDIRMRMNRNVIILYIKANVKVKYSIDLIDLDSLVMKYA